MWRLAVALAWAFILLLGGCGKDGGEGDLCDRTEECTEGMVCVTEVLNCQDQDCWGSCERECDRANTCLGGEICQQIGDLRVCRPSDYEDPL